MESVVTLFVVCLGGRGLSDVMLFVVFLGGRGLSDVIIVAMLLDVIFCFGPRSLLTLPELRYPKNFVSSVRPSGTL